MILNPGTTHSKGTAILFNTNKYTEFLNHHKSEDRRILLINIKMEDKTICLITLMHQTILMKGKVLPEIKQMDLKICTQQTRNYFRRRYELYWTKEDR